jgi:hypothetical protein
VDDKTLKLVAGIAVAVMVAVVAATQWESIATLVSSPEQSQETVATNTAPKTTGQPVATNAYKTIVHSLSEKEKSAGQLKFTPDSRPNAERIANGERLSLTFCATCHVRPAPDVFTNVHWSQTLPRMASWIGVQPPDEGLINPTGFERVLEAGVFPGEPMMSVREWKDIVDYYIQTSPKTLPEPKRPSLSLELELFEPVDVKAKFDATVMMVRVNNKDGGVWVMHETSRTLHRLGPNLQWLPNPIKLETPAASIIYTKAGFVAPLIGSFTPSFVPQGQLVRLNGNQVEPLTGLLHRPTSVVAGDFNADGREDLAVTEHGHVLGRAFWLEKTDAGYQRHKLLDLPGTLNFATGHFNDDGIPDLVTLTGQAREAAHLLLSTGPGKFEHRMILPRHPAWGHSHIEVVDFNKDGHPDLLITNGDNGELNNYPPKHYNGVRLHLNDGKNNFGEAAFFYPQYGTYRALAADFDGDGDLDIATMAFFGRHDISPSTGFVFLRQDKSLEFSAHTLPATLGGRWLTMDAGDIDGDGDIDIALGAFNEGPGQKSFPDKFNQLWIKNPVPVLILRNRTK